MTATTSQAKTKLDIWADEAYLAPPPKPETHTVAECEAVLKRRVKHGRTEGETTDAWLGELRSAMCLDASACPTCGKAPGVTCECQ